MSSIRKVPNSKRWYAVFRDRNGRQYNRSTQIKDVGNPGERAAARRKALEIALKYEAIARGEGITEARIRKTITELAELATGRKIRQPTISQYLNDWLQSVETQKSYNTYKRYKKVIESFLQHLGKERSASPLDTLLTSEIQGYLDSELKAGKATKTEPGTPWLFFIPEPLP